ncbi:MAG: monofunctional biosynthetic peptidoglycan transglycosylase [Chitinivibrionales bacterium]|nr:monofunctional biosynthetic peptidoglycan transglycosylase [Chitinivibrionales bacterium]
MKGKSKPHRKKTTQKKSSGTHSYHKKINRVLKEKITFHRDFLMFAAALCLAIIASILYYFIYPDVSELKKNNPKVSAFMQYRQQQWNTEGRKQTMRHTYVPLSRISPYLVKAVIISEDAKFWKHEGFDFDAIQYALEQDLKAKRFKYGASTISQQLAKNLFLHPSKNPVRKLKEAILTWRLEHTLSKNRIIELYLNFVELGDGIFGAEAATRYYFKKPAVELTAKEAARLAVILPNPIKFNPVSQSGYVVKRSNKLYRALTPARSLDDNDRVPENVYQQR